MPDPQIVKESENRALIDHFRNDQRVEVIGAGGLQLLSVPSAGGGREVRTIKRFLAEFRTAPERCKGTSEHTTLPSFIGHVERFKDAGTVLFVDVADKASPSLLAVYDYNSGPGAARFGQHRALYRFPLSEEWRAWNAAFANGLSMTTFAELLEERLGDVLDPESAGESAKKLVTELGMSLATPRQLLDLSRGLALRVDQNVKQVQKLSSGEASIAWEEKHEATDGSGAPLKIPGGFILAIPVFENGDLFQVTVRLRYSQERGRITWKLVPSRLSKVFDVATREAAEQARLATDVPLYFGKPEPRKTVAADEE